MKASILLTGLSLALLAACGEAQDANSGVTPEEAADLNETENMLESPPGLDEALPSNVEAPADETGELAIDGGADDNAQ